MKKIFPVILPLLLSSFTAFGQLEKGNVLLGGSLSYSASKTNAEMNPFQSEKKNSQFDFSPDLGIFLDDTWVLGISLPFRWSTTTSQFNTGSSGNSGINESKISSMGIAPFVRKYYPIGEKLSAFGQIQLGFIQESSKTIPNGNPANESLSESNYFNFIGTLGLSYFPKNWLGINLSLSPITFTSSSYQDQNYTENTEGDGQAFSFGLDSNAISLGINFFLVKK
mgnify:CR=1 FL=1